MTLEAKKGSGLVLTLNVGSSSLKFGVFVSDRDSDAVLRGQVELSHSPEQWLDRILHEAEPVKRGREWVGVGHRVVHGGPRYATPQAIFPKLIAELKRIIPFAPEHLPAEIALIEEVARRFPDLRQVACFDTGFHRDLPRVARVLPIPRRYEAAGVRRYGFHGLSYEFLRSELMRLGDPAVKKGRVILAHLGNGASLAALRDGVCIDTSMAFTPAAGLVMGTRTGDMDPGLLAYLAQTEGMTPQRLDRMVNHESGLLGISEITADMRDLVQAEKLDPRAAEAVAVFCYQTKKWIGAYAAALGGLDTLVFSGGIGSHDATIRSRICAGLGFLGVAVDDTRNASSALVISAVTSRVVVRVLPTNEERIIAGAVVRLLAGHNL